MKNICFFIGSIGSSGGTERVTSMIANELARKDGYKISILSLNDGLHSFFELNENITLAELFSNKVSMKRHYLSCIYRIRRYIKENKVDTFIVVDSISCVFSVPALSGLKINHICWEHFNFNVDLGISYRRLGRKWAARYCDYVVTLTQRDKELWQSGLKNIKAKIMSIANPTPFDHINHKPTLKSKIVLAVGRLTYQKGYDLLIESWSEVCRYNKDWKLQIVGSGEDELALKDQADQLGISHRIEFIQATKNIDYYYRNASFYCMSSRFEGLPMVLLEAQAYGLPIVSFDCETGPSEIINDGSNGYLSENNNIRDLAKSLIKFIEIKDDQYKSFVDSSILNLRRFNIGRIILDWEKIF